MNDHLKHKGSKRNAAIRRLIWPVFLLFALYFLLGSGEVVVPSADVVAISPSQIAIAPMRKVLGDPPLSKINGFERDCLECHEIFNTRDDVDSQSVNQHDHIKMNHGLNKECLTCHDRENRNLLSLYGNDTVSFNKVEMLCAKCHGPVYRDWQKGMHGKTIGYWDESSGEKIKYTCTQCHDPHSPSYESMAPLPGPNTLRMGEQDSEGAHLDRHTPLRTWSRGHETHNVQEDH